MDPYKGTTGDLGIEVAEALSSVHSILTHLIADLDLSSKRERYATDLQVISDVIQRIDPNI